LEKVDVEEDIVVIMVNVNIKEEVFVKFLKIKLLKNKKNKNVYLNMKLQEIQIKFVLEDFVVIEENVHLKQKEHVEKLQDHFVLELLQEAENVWQDFVVD